MQRRRSIHSLIPEYKKNGVVQLVAATGVAFILMKFAIVCLMVYGAKGSAANQIVENVVGLPQVYWFWQKPWTLLTYGWPHFGFWAWLSNMLWLFLFGSSFQLLAGYKQIIPLFIFSYLFAGIVYLLLQWLPISVFHLAPPAILGANASIAAFATAAIILAPKYRFFFAEHFSVRLWMILILYMFLAMLNVSFQALSIAWLLAGALAGFIFAKAFMKGYRPGDKVYAWLGKISSVAKPKTKQEPLTTYQYEQQKEKKLDTILDKIHDKGYDALTEEERQFLIKASKE